MNDVPEIRGGNGTYSVLRGYVSLNRRGRYAYGSKRLMLRTREKCSHQGHAVPCTVTHERHARVTQPLSLMFVCLRAIGNSSVYQFARSCSTHRSP